MPLQTTKPLLITLSNGVRVNAAHISSYSPSDVEGEGSCVTMSDGASFYPKETPEQIDQLILRAAVG